MKRIVPQILFALMTALLLLCGWFTAPLLGRVFATQSLSAQTETDSTKVSIEVQTLKEDPLYSFLNRGKIVGLDSITSGMTKPFASGSLDLGRLIPMINFLYRGTSADDEAVYREDGIEFSEGYMILSLYQCAPITVDDRVGGVVAYGPGGLVCTGDDTLAGSGTEEQQNENLRSMLLSLQALRRDRTIENHDVFSDLLGAAQLSDSEVEQLLFFLLCDGKMQLYRDAQQHYYLGFSDPSLDMALYLRLNVGAKRITGLSLLCLVSEYGGEYDIPGVDEVQ